LVTDSDMTINRILSSFTGRHIYAKALGSNLLSLLKRHVKVLLSDPEHAVAKAVPFALALNNPTLEKFDDTFTRLAGGAPPTFPFASATDYYRWGSSHNVIKDVTVPYLSINAADDPVVHDVPTDGQSNGLVVMGLTAGGGHLGWFQAGPGYVDRWTTKPVLEWLHLVGGDLAHQPRTAAELYFDDEGFLREMGQPLLGCKEVPGGGNQLEWR
jgi:predicted alpha/beta-fold hydrolase